MSSKNTELKGIGELDDVALVDIKGKQHPSADGLVDRAHRNSNDRGAYFIGSNAQVVQCPRDDNNNTCIVWAKVTLGLLEPGPNGETEISAEAIGDANPDNCTERVAAHFIRMAETRAKARAYSEALNIGGAVDEEFGPQGGSSSSNRRSSGSGNASADPSKKGKLWNGLLWYGDCKGKHFTDPDVDIKSLEWGMRASVHERDGSPKEKISPKDQEQHDMLEAEIERRQNGSSNKGEPNGKDYTPPGKKDNKASSGDWKPAPKQIGELMKAAKAAGNSWPEVKEICEGSFGVADPAKLTSEDDWDALTAMVS